MAGFDKIVVVTQKTALEELIERFNTHEQARFYIEHMGASFQGYQDAHDAYRKSLDSLHGVLPEGVRRQFIERGFLPNFLFGPKDLVVTLGRDGLVVNVAKYLSGQPIVGMNPDPVRIDGVLLPFAIADAKSVLIAATEDKLAEKKITMAKASLNDGQSMYAVNDLFIGQKTHCSARYRLRFGEREEDQSSSGIIVSTGAGSTGWFRSILAGASAVACEMGAGKSAAVVRDRYPFSWEALQLYFCVREPFVSRTTGADLAFGKIARKDSLKVFSQMPQNGVIFSDGIESDHLQFNSGAIADIAIADKKVHLLVPLPRPKSTAKKASWTNKWK